MKRTSDQVPEREYWFKPVEEWLPAPVVRIKDIRTKKIIEFPKIQNIEETESEQQLHSNNGVVLIADDHETDTNNNHVVVNKVLKEQQQQVVVRLEDTPSIWRSLPDGSRYAQIPPIYDQAVGVEIQRQMDEEGLTAQSVVGRALALTQ